MSQFKGLFSILCLLLAHSGTQAWDFLDRETTPKAGEFPWVVELQHNCEKYMISGGSLISNYIVLTSSKSFEGLNASEIEVTNNIGISVRVRSILRHPDFNLSSGANNLALLFLRKKVDSIPHINIATRSSKLDLNRCIVKNQIKKTLPMKVVSSDACQQQFASELGASFRLDSSLMCAGGGINRNICDEDDGYPLMCPLASVPTQFKLVGIVNWHLGCSQGPGVYTNVTKLRDWIIQQVRQNPYIDETEDQDNECDFNAGLSMNGFHILPIDQ